MNEHERVRAAYGDHGGRDDRLAEPRRGGENAGFVLKQRIGRAALLGGEFAEKVRIEPTPRIALVAQLKLDAEFVEQCPHRLGAAARQGDVMRQQFSAGDDTGDAEGGTAHRLCPEELGVLEGGEANEPVDQTRRQAGAWDIELVRRHRIDAFRQRSSIGWRGAPARGRRGPGRLVFLIQRQAKAHHRPWRVAVSTIVLASTAVRRRSEDRNAH